MSRLSEFNLFFIENFQAARVIRAFLYQPSAAFQRFEFPAWFTEVNN